MATNLWSFWAIRTYTSMGGSSGEAVTSVTLKRQVDNALGSRRPSPALRGGVGLAQVDQRRGAPPLHRDRLAARGEVNSVRPPLG